MISVKIQCVCGQTLAFDVEPVEGRMPYAVQCPVCGQNATAAANVFIAQRTPYEPPVARPATSIPEAAPLNQAPSPAFLETPTWPPRRKSTWVIPCAAAVVTLVVAALAFFFWQRQRENKPAVIVSSELPGLPNTGEELNRWYVEPPEGRNAAQHFTNGFAQLQITEKDRSLPLLGKVKLPALDQPIPSAMKKELSAFLARNEKAMDSFAQARQYDQCRYPVDLSQGYNAALPYLSKIKEAAQLAMLTAMSGSDRKDAATAVLGVSVGLSLARSLEEEPVLISQLVRLACEKYAADGLEQTLNRVALSPGTLEEFQATLAKMERRESDGESLTRCLIGERVMFLAIVNQPQKFLQNFSNPSGSADPKTRENYAKALKDINHRKERNFFEESFRQILALRKEKFPARLQVVDYMLQRETEATNQNVLLFPMFTMPKQVTREASALGYLRLSMTAVALERFRSANGNNYPNTLAELAPQFLKEIPTDPFDGAPLRYKRSGRGYWLYSIGQDLKDDGGSDEESGKGDLVFEIINPPKSIGSSQPVKN